MQKQACDSPQRPPLLITDLCDTGRGRGQVLPGGQRPCTLLPSELRAVVGSLMALQPIPEQLEPQRRLFITTVFQRPRTPSRSWGHRQEQGTAQAGARGHHTLSTHTHTHPAHTHTCEHTCSAHIYTLMCAHNNHTHAPSTHAHMYTRAQHTCTYTKHVKVHTLGTHMCTCTHTQGAHEYTHF